MIDQIIEASARNRFLVILLVACATAVPGRSARALDALRIFPRSVIVFTDWPGRSPDIVEEITYPIISTMIAAPKVKYGRGDRCSATFVNVVFPTARTSL
jgi:Cu(I)/Ag(I) efflux system membrane protein CusA/SilA